MPLLVVQTELLIGVVFVLDQSESNDVLMTQGQGTYKQRLSPDARTVLKVLCHLESYEHHDQFQMTSDLKRIHAIVSSYRGSLCSDLKKRLESVHALGDVEVITSRDILSLIDELYHANISKLKESEIVILKAVFGNPEVRLSELEALTGIKYSKARRAWIRLASSGILRRVGIINANQLAFERILLILSNPLFILSGPYVTSTIFADAERAMVYQTLLIPAAFSKGFRKLVVDLRNSSDNVSAWWLSPGTTSFNDSYYDRKSNQWRIDLLHFRLLLRKHVDELVVGETKRTTLNAPISRLGKSKLLVMKHLLKDYDSKVQDVSIATKLSRSIVFRKRSEIINERAVLPRIIVKIPALTEGVVSVADSSTAAMLHIAMSKLPFSFFSLLENIDRPSIKKVIILSSTPMGQAKQIVSILEEERSMVDNLETHVITAGEKRPLDVIKIFDLQSMNWKCDSSFFDVRTYSTVRKEVIHNNCLSIDLA